MSIGVFRSFTFAPYGSLHEHVNGVDDSRKVTAKGEQKANPELNSTSELEKYSKRRQYDGQNNFDKCHCTHFRCRSVVYTPLDFRNQARD
ncbi:hypothetical protein Mapa_004702 [Marchantia paleacea]|nr:hypothetical protein Mapa_004702 [Marchantia paleacea]